MLKKYIFFTLKYKKVDFVKLDYFKVHFEKKYARIHTAVVSFRLRTPSGQVYDVIYVGTTRGKVIKFVSAIDINALNPVDTAKPVVIEEIQVFPYHVSVTNLQVVKVKEMDDEPRLIVLSNHEVRGISCGKVRTFGITHSQN